MDQKYSGLSKILYLLDDEYSRKTLTNHHSEDGGSHWISKIHSVAAEIGLQVGLAQVELYLSGKAQENNEDELYRGYNREFDDRSGFDFEMGTVATTELDVTHLFDLQGNLVTETFYLEDSHDETIPRDLVREVGRGSPYEADVEKSDVRTDPATPYQLTV